MGNDLYLRTAHLIVSQKFREGETNIPQTGKKFSQRINFSIKKSPDKNANNARITIYNLSPESRSFIQQFGDFDSTSKKKDADASTKVTGKPGTVWLTAGYAANIPQVGSEKLIFFGDIKEHKINRSGPDVLLTVEADDGGTAITRAILTLGLAENCTNRQIFEAIADAFQLTMRSPFSAAIPNKVYKKGYVYNGPAKYALDEITKEEGLEWSVQNGELQISKTNEAVNQEAVYLSQETGLIGIPTRTSAGIQAKSLLNPKIFPGGAVKIKSKELDNVLFKVTNVQHSGDTDSGEWESDFEGVTIG